jgi:uncharacterized membrane protein YfcA
MLDFHLHHGLMLLLALTGLLAGTVDAIAGGGGMISLPMLMLVGMPAHLALGTNKLQGSIGTLMAAINYYRRGMWSLKTIYKGLIFGFVGAASGAYLSQHISSAILGYIIPILLIAVLLYSIFMPSLGLIDRHPRMPEQLFFPLAGMILGFYDGFFGPATGSFWVFALVFFLGYNLAKATAYTKVFNLKSNIFATICFAIGHNIDYRAGLIMATGQFIGGQLGSHLVIKNGAKFVRPVFLTMVLLATLVLLGKQIYMHFGR